MPPTPASDAPLSRAPSSDVGLHIAAIALGSNLPSDFGTTRHNLEEALRRLAAVVRVNAVSSFHHTAPVGYLDQPNFLNAAALLETSLTPESLLDALLSIESAMGRDRSTVPIKGPRVIDLDLLLYDDIILTSTHLTLPHRAMHTRRFVLAPLAEIVPAWLHPITGTTVASMLANLAP